MPYLQNEASAAAEEAAPQELVRPVKTQRPKRNRKLEWKKDLKKNWPLYLLFIPAFVFFAIFSYVPMLGILMAFQDVDATNVSPFGDVWVGWENFERLFTAEVGGDFPIAIRNTVVMALLSLTVGFVFPVILALLVSEVRSKAFRRFVQTVTYMPYFITAVIICQLVKELVGNTGAITELLGVFSYEGGNLLGQEHPPTFWLIYLFTDIWQNAGYSSIVFVASIAAIDTSLYEAAARDERPDENGVRLRDSQCGLFATGKVLRRFRVPFTYLCNCNLEDEAFERGVKLFLAVCNTVKEFRKTRILQIGPRPFDFWSTMCNEGELLEKFNIQLAPVPLAELTAEMKKAKAEGKHVRETIEYCRKNFKVSVSDEQLENVAALKDAMRNLAEKYGCNAGCIQCWNALQDEIGIMPCAANSLLNEEGFPVACETDIHGAITSVLVEAAGMGVKRSFFADWTVRHPDNENGELLQHCGPWPKSCLSCTPEICYPLAFDYPGAVAGEAKHGTMTLARFDGDNGEYSLLLGNAKGIDGPYTKGTYVWVEVKNWKRLEAKIVEGPYIHHCVGIHEDVVPVLYEACKYLGIKPDLYDDVEEDVKAYIRGE